MKYFKMNKDMREEVIGKDYPQVWDFIKGYNPKKGLYRLYDDCTSLQDDVDLSGFIAKRTVKMTDFLSTAFTNYTFLINDKFKQVLDKFNLPEHRYYPAKVHSVRMKETYDYYLIKILGNYNDMIDLSKPYSTYTKWGMELYDEATMSDAFKDMNLDIFRVSLFHVRWIVSERLKNAIEEAGLTGIIFEEAKLY